MGLRDRLLDAQSSLLGRLRPSGVRGRAGAGRIHVIGNCQGQAVAHALRMLLPERDIAFTSVFGIAGRYRRMADLVAATQDAEAVFATAFAAPFRDGGGFEDLRAGTRLHVVPTIVFAAFHPDAIYVGERAEEAPLMGPMGGHHSALALYGYLEGFGPGRTERLFRAEAFRRLGYLDSWDASVATLLERGRHAGFPLEEAVLRWTRRGAFMHGINHPKMFVSADLARGLLRRAGIAFEEIDLDGFLPDDVIRSGTWPVYPAVGVHYGVPASELFLKAPTRKTGPARTMTLRQFVEASHASYDTRARSALRSVRVEGWRQDERTRRDLAALAA